MTRIGNSTAERITEAGEVRVRSRSTRGAVLVAMSIAAVLVLSGLAIAKPATLHLSAVVYDVRSSNGGHLTSSKEKVYEGTSKLGEDYSRCTQTTKGSAHCIGSYTLKGGSILFSGTVSTASDTDRLAITGGTGSYRGARGTVVTEYNKAGTKAKETLTFK
jgi:hypothetical protein